ncbi:glycosyltransferase family 4 protein [Rhizobium sp. S95]|uniref:Glycosyltransferase family 4 protein n=1 Tax=Ciceribacter sichuanensis TaxID=2949647 RepID=A0AAJ1C0Q9_9HYPH|nr:MULTISPECIES: glycosyltransferase family 4 protein [unclassified Ciceribacter]MCM2397989.1 glycosyltransferase family 4 protein [Ciceribacter sp. S95]MCO5959205.1 glycosyltransferase family 4 protein [Ciceribacter sp. S101]
MAFSSSTAGSIPLGKSGSPLVVQVVRQYPPSRGGLEDVVSNLSRLLLKRGFRVRVVTLDRLFVDPGTTLPAHDVIDGVEVVRIPWKGSSRYPVAPQVFRHIGDADLVHVHAIDFFFDALAWTRPFHGKPMVATTHGGFFHTKNYAAIKNVWFKTVTRLSASAYRSVVCCSQSDLDLFAQIANRRSVLVENGVDNEKFARLSSPVPQRRIITIGRFSVNKRLDRLFDTIYALNKIEPGWALDVVGSVSDHSEADIRNEIARRGLEGQVTLHVGLENSEVRKLIGLASLFASASEYEGFGLVAVEAMSAGLVPVLHTNDAYNALGNRHGGIFLADFARPEEAAAAVRKAYQYLSSDPEAVRNAMIDAAATHAWASVADRYAAIYEDALRGRPVRASA